MEQQLHTKTNISSAMCELHLLNRANSNSSMLSTSAPTTTTTTLPIGINQSHAHNTESASMQQRALSMMQHHRQQQPVLLAGSPLLNANMFGDSSNSSGTSPNTNGAAKIQMSLNSRYISKITHNVRKIVDTSLRMRPYFIPERSRTKSENNVERDSYASLNYPACMSGDSGGGGGGNFGATACATMNQNSNASMMETCDAYLNMDGINNSSNTNNNASSVGGVTFNIFNSCQNHNCSSLVDNATAISMQHPNQHPHHFRPSLGPSKYATLVQLKKSKSLEDVRVENSIDGSQPSHEMEFVSSRIQKLKVQE